MQSMIRVVICGIGTRPLLQVNIINQIKNIQNKIKQINISNVLELKTYKNIDHSSPSDSLAQLVERGASNAKVPG